MKKLMIIFTLLILASCGDDGKNGINGANGKDGKDGCKMSTEKTEAGILLLCDGNRIRFIENVTEDSSTICDYNIDNLLSQTSQGDYINGYTGELGDLFSNNPPSEYSSGSYCSRTYDFNQYDSVNGGWCYYYSISTDCSGTITSIYIAN